MNNSISLRKLSSLLKNADIPCAKANSSRIRGWSNCGSEGYSVDNLYPWTTYWTRDGIRHSETIDEQEVSLSYSLGFTSRGPRTDTRYTRETGIDAIQKVLDENGIAYERQTNTHGHPSIKINITRI